MDQWNDEDEKVKTPLVDQNYLLERFPGKGGWTYARIPEVLQDKEKSFGWVRVSGSIDSHLFEHFHLMPMGNGTLFLPVKASIRKVIMKHEGDWVHIVLFPDHIPVEIPHEMKLCLMDAHHGLDAFLSLPQGEQKRYIEWIYSAKNEETKANRIVTTIDQVTKNIKKREKQT